VVSEEIASWVVVAFVAVAFVKTAVLGVVAPIVVLLMVPPVMVGFVRVRLVPSEVVATLSEPFATERSEPVKSLMKSPLVVRLVTVVDARVVVAKVEVPVTAKVPVRLMFGAAKVVPLKVKVD
jgi:hypothetical protein